MIYIFRYVNIKIYLPARAVTAIADVKTTKRGSYIASGANVFDNE